MTSVKQPLRYAHAEGHVDACYDEHGQTILTCGSEGDVRVYKGFDDDDPTSHRAGEVVFSIACMNNRFYTGSDDNAIQAHKLEDGEPDGIVTRFTAPVTHMQLNKSGSKLVAGASDFTVRIADIKSSSHKNLQEHEAPVLSIALDPQEKFVASSSCDGCVKVYDLEKQKVVHTIPGLPKCNDFSAAKSLCRLCWSADGQLLMVPMDKEIKVFKSSNWEHTFSLSDITIKEVMSISSLSPCGKYVAGACRDGAMYIWDLNKRVCILREHHEKGFSIVAMAWNPKNNGEIVYADKEGQLGLLENVIPKESAPAQSKVPGGTEDLAGLFDDDDDDDDMLVQATNPQSHKTAALVDDDDDDNDDGVIAPRVKSTQRVMDDADEDSKDFDIGKIKAETMGLFNDDEMSEHGSEVPPAQPPATPAVQYVRGFEPPPMQQPFQPSSTPTHLSNRFMVWNSVGTIIQYNTDEEQSINVEFHDTSTHHALHIVNNLNHSMADLSSEALALACESGEDSQSTLVCMHFGSWDSSKEWSTSMSGGEDIQCICIGDGWVAVATDKRLVRIFSVGGVQRQIFSLPGPVVAMSGHSNQLLVVYHKGMAIPGDQCLGVRLSHVMGKKTKTVLTGDHLPLSAKSTLSWVGFSAEGTPLAMDSCGVLRMLNRSYGRSWTQVADLKSHCKGKSDNYWIVSILENPEQIRAVLCKGAKYPPILPRPNMAILPFKIPLCEMETEKSTIEEKLWKSNLFSQHFQWWSTEGFEFDEYEKEKAMGPQKEYLMKMFALACKTDREFRALEICEMMPNSHTVQLAIKYASRLGRMPLAEKLTALARQKSEEELAEAQLESEEEPEEIDVTRDRKVLTMRPGSSRQIQPQECEITDSPMEEKGGGEDMAADNEDEAEEDAKPTFLTLKKPIEKKEMPRSLTNSQKGNKNPFKIAPKKVELGGGLKGSSVFDSIGKSKSISAANRQPLETTPETQNGKKRVSQPKMFLGKKSTAEKKTEKAKPPKQSAFQYWFEANMDALKEESPDLSEDDLTMVAAKQFKELSKEDKQKWQDKAKGTPAEDSMKRKRSEESEDVENRKSQSDKTMEPESKKTKVLNASSKLASFAFNKD